MNPLDTPKHVLWLCPPQSILWLRVGKGALAGNSSTAVPIQGSSLASLFILTQVARTIGTLSALKHWLREFYYSDCQFFKVFLFLWSLFPVLFYWAHFIPFSREGNLFFFYNGVFLSGCVPHSFPYGIISCAWTLHSSSDTRALCTFAGCPSLHDICSVSLVKTFYHSSNSYSIASYARACAWGLGYDGEQEAVLPFQFSWEGKRTDIKWIHAYINM